MSHLGTIQAVGRIFRVMSERRICGKISPIIYIIHTKIEAVGPFISAHMSETCDIALYGVFVGNTMNNLYNPCKNRVCGAIYF